MNIALPALVVFLILLPGFIVRSGFKRAERSSLDYSPFGQVVAEAVLWACVLHLLWLTVSDVALGRELRMDLLLKLLSSEPTGQSKAAEAVALQWHWAAAYFGTLLGASFVVPALARTAIAKRRWDRVGHPLSRLLRFHGAPWYYLLTGADFEESATPDFIVVSAIVDVAGRAFLYTGVLDDFYLDQDGQLDRLVLEEVQRRPLEADKSIPPQSADDVAPSRFYPIDGQYFVLRYSEAITLNVQYVKFIEGAMLADFDTPEGH